MYIKVYMYTIYIINTYLCPIDCLLSCFPSFFLSNDFICPPPPSLCLLFSPVMTSLFSRSRFMTPLTPSVLLRRGVVFSMMGIVGDNGEVHVVAVGDKVGFLTCSSMVCISCLTLKAELFKTIFTIMISKFTS